MKRVLSLTTLWPNAAEPRLGQFVGRSLEALARNGDWRVTVINPIGLPPLAIGRYRALAEAAVAERMGQIEVFRPTFRTIPRFGASGNPHRIARAVLPLARELHAAAPFSLVDAQFFFPEGPAAVEIARALKLPLSIKARGSDIHYWGRRADTREQVLGAAEAADGLLAVSEALRADMVGMGMDGEKIALHTTGLDRDRFRPLRYTDLRRKLGREFGIALPESAPVLVSVGALMDRKGQHLVIDALGHLPSDTRVLLIGKGEAEAALRARARAAGVDDRVHFLGSLDHDLMPLMLSAADVMVLASEREGLANAWVEAIACGTPVVIPDIGGAREVVTGPDAGRISAREPQAIAAAVRDILADPPAREEVARLAERFSWDANGAALAAHYERLIGGA